MVGIANQSDFARFSALGPAGEKNGVRIIATDIPPATSI